MSIFGKIKDAIFGKPASAQTLPDTPVPGSTGGSPTGNSIMPSSQPPAEVDVGQVLTGIASSKGGSDLNWRTSIVDLMKLLDMDSSLANRKELATELGYPGEKDGSAEMNLWLHKQVMRELAANGGKVPAEMLD